MHKENFSSVCIEYKNNITNKKIDFLKLFVKFNETF